MKPSIQVLILLIWIPLLSCGQSFDSSIGVATDNKAYFKVQEQEILLKQDSVQLAAYKAKYAAEKNLSDSLVYLYMEKATDLKNCETNFRAYRNRATLWGHVKNGVLYVESAVIIGAATYLYLAK